MFSRFSFKAKLVSLCVFLVTISVLVGGIGFVGLTTVSGRYSEIMEKSQPKLELTYKMYLSYRRVRITLRTLGITGVSAADAQTAMHDAQEAVAQYDALSDEYEKLGYEEGQKELYQKMDAAWEDFKVTGVKAINLQKSGTPEDHAKLLQLFFTECPTKAKVFTVAVDAVVAYHKKSSVDHAAEAANDAHRATLISILAIVLGCSLGLVIGVIFASTVTKSIGKITEALAENATQVSSASAQIAGSSAALSQSTTEQASSLQETAASVEEMNSMVVKSSQNAKLTAETSTSSQAKANEGKQVIEQMLVSMTEINESNSNIMGQIGQSNQQMTEIVKVIQEIGEKTKVINDIVFQTKLLSFNASVEAARAGEHGKGFAVVAEEVGNLAQMSGNAAKEISTMLESSTTKVKAIVEETKQKVEVLGAKGKEKVEAGSAVARRCAEVLDEIVLNVSSTSQMAEEISQASQEQAAGIHEITKAMSQLDQTTQQNAATSEETASAAEQLSSQAESLKNAVGELTQTMQGKSADLAPREEGNVTRIDRAAKRAKHKAGFIPDALSPEFKEG